MSTWFCPWVAPRRRGRLSPGPCVLTGCGPPLGHRRRCFQGEPHCEQWVSASLQRYANVCPEDEHFGRGGGQAGRGWGPEPGRAAGMASGVSCGACVSTL